MAITNTIHKCKAKSNKTSNIPHKDLSQVLQLSKRSMMIMQIMPATLPMSARRGDTEKSKKKHKQRQKDQFADVSVS